MANHKYIERKWVKGRWVYKYQPDLSTTDGSTHRFVLQRSWKDGGWEYKYRTDDRSSDQLRLDTEREKAYRGRMLDQSQAAFERELEKERKNGNQKSKATDRAAEALKRNNRLYGERILTTETNRILHPEDQQNQLRKAYAKQSLGTKIKADARSAADDMKEQAGKAKKVIAETTTAAKKTIAEKTAAAKKMANDTTRKISSLSSKAVDKGKTTVSKILDKFKKKK